jgi:hypothetical protein
MTETYDFIEDALGADSPASSNDAKENVIVGPLTDDDIYAGGLARVVCFVRTKTTKSAIRKRKQRANNKDKREINVVAANNDSAREFIRKMAAATIQDAAAENGAARLQPIIDSIYSNSEYRALISDLSARPDVWQAVRAAWRDPRTARRGREFSIQGLVKAAKRILMRSLVVRFVVRVLTKIFDK